MGILYDRTEDSEEIVIRLKYYTVNYASVRIVGLGALAGVFDLAPSRLLDCSAIVFGFLFLVSTVIYWKPFREIKIAKETDKASRSGSKFSFFNPVTYVIEKKEEKK